MHVYTVFIYYTVAGNCLLNFTEQPITFAACLLYDAERIVLMCTISSESEDLLNPDLLDPNGIIIRWYYNNGTESELTVGTNETRREGGNGDPIVISSTLTISPISQHDAVTLAQGSYYCRVQVDKEILRSNSSQQFIVLNIGDYVQYGTSCAERNFIVRDNACAVFSTVETKGSESLPTISYRNNSITDVIMAQEVDTTFVVIQSSSNQSDEIWIYILVAVLTAFFIIIIVLTIFVLRLTLMIRKSQPRSNVDRKSQHACTMKHSWPILYYYGKCMPKE